MRLNSSALYPFGHRDPFAWFFSPSFARERERAEWPELVVRDEGEKYVLTGDLPGVAAKDLELTAQGSEVVVKGARQQGVPTGYTVRRQERADFRFARTLELPTAIDADGVVASLENGVLTITIPKAKDARPRTITVKGASQ
jgi:HSP20 family protein